MKCINKIFLRTAIVFILGISMLVCISCNKTKQTLVLDNNDKVEWDSSEIMISLEENGTTGYKWNIETDLEITENNFESPSNSSLGAPGMRKIVITANNNDNNYIVLKYQRSWNKQIAKEYKLNACIDNGQIKQVNKIN